MKQTTLLLFLFGAMMGKAQTMEAAYNDYKLKDTLNINLPLTVVGVWSLKVDTILYTFNLARTKDTVKVMALMCDTSQSPDYYDGQYIPRSFVFWRYILQVREKHNEAEGVIDWSFNYPSREPKDYWVSTGEYLTLEKTPLPKNLVVWMVK